MAKPITWRTIGNTVTGASAQALQGAMAAFTGIGDDAQKRLENIRVGEDRDLAEQDRAQADLTSETLARAIADPSVMDNLPEGVNVAEIAQGLSSYQANQASTEASLANTEFRGLQSAGLEFDQSDEQREIAAAERKQVADDRSANLGLRRQELQSRLNSAKRITDSEDRIAATNTAWVGAERELGAGYDERLAKRGEAYKQNFPGDEEGYNTFMADGAAARESNIQHQMGQNLNEFQRKALDANPHLTAAEIAQTTFGEVRGDARQVAKTYADKFAELEATRVSYLEKASQGAGNFMVRNASGEWAAVNTAAQATANLLGKREGLSHLRSMEGLGDVSDSDKEFANQIRNLVGGGKDAFNAVFEDPNSTTDNSWTDGRHLTTDNKKAAIKLARELGDSLKLKAAASAAVQPGQIFFSEEAQEAKSQGQTADRLFLEEQGTDGGESADPATIAAQLSSDDTIDQVQGVASLQAQIKTVTTALADVSPAIKARHPRQIRQLENALKQVSAKEKIGRPGRGRSARPSMLPVTADDRVAAMNNAVALLEGILTLDKEQEKIDNAKIRDQAVNALFQNK